MAKNWKSFVPKEKKVQGPSSGFEHPPIDHGALKRLAEGNENIKELLDERNMLESKMAGLIGAPKEKTDPRFVPAAITSISERKKQFNEWESKRKATAERKKHDFIQKKKQKKAFGKSDFKRSKKGQNSIVNGQLTSSTEELLGRKKLTHQEKTKKQRDALKTERKKATQSDKFKAFGNTAEKPKLPQKVANKWRQFENKRDQYKENKFTQQESPKEKGVIKERWADRVEKIQAIEKRNENSLGRVSSLKNKLEETRRPVSKIEEKWDRVKTKRDNLFSVKEAFTDRRRSIVKEKEDADEIFDKRELLKNKLSELKEGARKAKDTYSNRTKSDSKKDNEDMRRDNKRNRNNNRYE